MRTVTFRVQATLNEGESICVTGSSLQLGNWKLHNCFPLSLDKADEGSELVWHGTTQVPDGVRIEFRYAICVILEPNEFRSERTIIIRQWETELVPRSIPAGDKSWEVESPHRFGYIGNVEKIEHGWLTVETVVQFKLYGNPIKIWKRRYANKQYYVKVTPIDLQTRASLELTDDSIDSLEELSDAHSKNKLWPIIDVAVMNDTSCEFTKQQQFGHLYNTDDFVTFQAQVLDVQTIAYMVDFFVHDHLKRVEDEIPVHIGFCYILPSILKNSLGSCSVPITGAHHQPIGQLTFDYMLVRSIADFDCDMSVSYARYWRKDRTGLDVGHRGAGNSFCLKHCSDVRENTLASLKLAAKHGADYVEFDVQLSKDFVPVLYHDFHVCINMKKKSPHVDDHDLLAVPLKDLTLHQLQMLKVNSVKEQEHKGSFANFRNDDDDESQPFPTLERALEQVASHVGFNVEIKWNMQRKDGTFEVENPFELNLYLDIILRTLLEHAGRRRIVISCFHPDVCTMVRMKQNKYPVLFLTQGQTSRWPAYIDPRTSSIPMAVYFARSVGILGIDVHTEDILKDQSCIQLCKEAGLVMFCWGDDNNDENVIRMLKSLGVDAIIYDKIFEKKAEAENVFQMEEKVRLNMMASVGNHSNQNEGHPSNGQTSDH